MPKLAKKLSVPVMWVVPYYKKASLLKKYLNNIQVILTTIFPILIFILFFRKSLANDRLITQAIIKLNDITQLLLKETSLNLTKNKASDSTYGIVQKFNVRHYLFLYWHLVNINLNAMHET